MNGQPSTPGGSGSLAPCSGKRWRDPGESTEHGAGSDDWEDSARVKRARTPGAGGQVLGELDSFDYLMPDLFDERTISQDGVNTSLSTQYLGPVQENDLLAIPAINDQCFESLEWTSLPDRQYLTPMAPWHYMPTQTIPPVPVQEGILPEYADNMDWFTQSVVGMGNQAAAVEAVVFAGFDPHMPDIDLQLKQELDGTPLVPEVIPGGTRQAVLDDETGNISGLPAAEIITPSEEIPQYDTCFGVVDDEIISSEPLGDAQDIKVAITTCSATGVLKEAESGKYRGLLGKAISTALQELKSRCSVTLDSVIKAPKTLSVVVYGLCSEHETVGDILAEHGIYLQLPSSFDPSVPYQNPQSFSFYTTRTTASDIPAREGKNKSQAGSSLLDSVTKSKVSELLDLATGPEEFQAVKATSKLKTKLKTFQMKALAMMVEKESGRLNGNQFPSVWTEDISIEGDVRYMNTVTGGYGYKPARTCLGGLLADDMGLGKTLTTLTLIAGSLNEDDRSTRRGKSTLIVTPLSILSNWKDQIEKHFEKDTLTFTIYHGVSRHKKLDEIECFDIVLTTYDILRSDCPSSFRGGKKSRGMLRSLHDTNWHRIVLDEAHVIRNRSSQAFRAAYALMARHRWCLTGTPIQNTIEDLGSLVSFLRVAPFDEAYTFRSHFVQVYQRGLAHRWKRLRALVMGISLRRTKESVGEELDLPRRDVLVESVSLDANERGYYNLMKQAFKSAATRQQSRMNSFQLIQRLRQICNHGLDLLPESEQEWMRNAAVYSTEFAPLATGCDKCGTALKNNGEGLVLRCFHQICLPCRRNVKTYRESSLSTEMENCPLCGSEGEGFFDGDVDPTGPCDIKQYSPSSKVKALLRNLADDKRIANDLGRTPPKSVVVSSWTGMLDLIGHALSAQGIEYQQLDGRMSLDQRDCALKWFRGDLSCEVLLTSLGAGGVGLDLTVASRIHLMEPGWNPMLERQALDRVHRLGQVHEVISRCYAVDGDDSIEQYILKKQSEKIRLFGNSFVETFEVDELERNIQTFTEILSSRH